MVLPSPTSSARMAPRDKGLRKAETAASIWCGLRLTWASDRTDVSFSTLSDAQSRQFVGDVTGMEVRHGCLFRKFDRQMQRGGVRRRSRAAARRLWSILG